MVQPARISGPLVATSATGRQLAMGPPGPPGPSVPGPPGPQGAPGTGSGPVTRTPVTSTILAATITSLVTANGGYAWLDITASASMTVNLPALSAGQSVYLYFVPQAAGPSSTVVVTVQAAGSGTLAHPNGPNSSLSDAPTNTFLFNDPGFQGNSYRYLATSTSGNYSVH
jgi:hypothetical protein